jgi:hypothetical protein
MTNKIFILITFAAFSAFSDTIYVNLDVDTSKITGSSKGLLSDKENIKTSAIINALENNGNVLVGGNIFYEIQGDSKTCSRITIEKINGKFGNRHPVCFSWRE